jgi:hypothetical protein
MKAVVVGYKKTQHSGKPFTGRHIRNKEQMYTVGQCDFIGTGVKSHFRCIYANVSLK